MLDVAPIGGGFKAPQQGEQAVEAGERAAVRAAVELGRPEVPLKGDDRLAGHLVQPAVARHRVAELGEIALQAGDRAGPTTECPLAAGCPSYWPFS